MRLCILTYTHMRHQCPFLPSQCIKEPHSHLALFSMDGIKAGARLEFIQNMEYKFVELLSLQFHPSTEDIVRQHITYRYNANKVRRTHTHTLRSSFLMKMGHIYW